MDESYCPAAKSCKIRISSEFFIYSNYAPVYTPPVFKNTMFWRYSYSQKHIETKQIELSRILQLVQICNIGPAFFTFFCKSTGIHKFLELLINIVMPLTKNLSGNGLFVNEH